MTKKEEDALKIGLYVMNTIDIMMEDAYGSHFCIPIAYQPKTEKLPKWITRLDINVPYCVETVNQKYKIINLNEYYKLKKNPRKK